MIRTTLVGLAVAALIPFAPVATAQSLEQEFEELHFREFLLSVYWDDRNKKATMVATGKDHRIDGAAASGLRYCIDNDEDDCPIEELLIAANGNDNDGEVLSDEVRNFEENLKEGLRLSPEVQEIVSNVRGIAKVDDLSVTSAGLTAIRLHDAEGDVASQRSIGVDAEVTGTFGRVQAANRHDVWIQRRESDLTLADTITVTGGRNWRIVSDSIEPVQMRQYFKGGRLTGTQDEFESTEPLTFTIEYHKKSPGPELVGILGVLAALVLARRKL